MKTHLEKTCIFYEFWHHFGRLLAPFWQPKCNQKSSEILDAILEVKKVAPRIFWGRLCGMRGGPGEDNGGVLERTPDKNRGREPRRRQGTLEVGSSTPSPVGRRNASRIPPRRAIQVVWLFVCLFVVCLFVSLFVCL